MYATDGGTEIVPKNKIVRETNLVTGTRSKKTREERAKLQVEDHSFKHLLKRVEKSLRP
jgi:hypothetical protein